MMDQMGIMGMQGGMAPQMGMMFGKGGPPMMGMIPQLMSGMVRPGMMPPGMVPQGMRPMMGGPQMKGMMRPGMTSGILPGVLPGVMRPQMPAAGAQSSAGLRMPQPGWPSAQPRPQPGGTPAP